MDHKNFEGTEILERLAELDLLDPFFEAVDADNLEKVGWLMRGAGFDRETIARVMKMIVEGEAEH